MGACQWIVIVIWGLQLLLALVLDGKEKLDRDGNPQRFSFSDKFASVAVGFILLYFGGFFN